MKLKIGLLLLLLISFYWSLSPLFGQGLFPIHDDTQTVRINQMGKSLLDMQLPVRWVADLGYGTGYPLFNFYSPLPYYFGATISFFSNDLILATKIMYGAGIILSGIGMYLLIFEIFGAVPALVCSVLYMYAPYHAVQIYVRGSVGEYWAYGWLPFILLGIYKVYVAGGKKWIILTSFFCAFLVLSHNIISLLFFLPAIVILIIKILIFKIKKKKIENLILVLKSIIIGLLLAGFFWIPAIWESQYTGIKNITQNGSDYHLHFVFPDQLWDSPWGFGGSGPERSDGMSFKIGKIQLILGLLGILIMYQMKFLDQICNKKFYFSQYFIFLLIFSAFMLIPQSVFIWDAFSNVLKYVQFPWRYLLFINLSISFLAAYTILAIKNKYVQLLSAGFVIIITILINSKYFQPKYLSSYGNNYYISKENIVWIVSKISDEYLPSNYVKPDKQEALNKKLIINTNITPVILEEKTDMLKIVINQTDASYVVINKTYFPGWTAFIDGYHTEIINKKGLISLLIPQGKHEVTLLFSNTLIRLFGNTLSIVTLLLLTFYLFFKPKKTII